MYVEKELSKERIGGGGGGGGLMGYEYFIAGFIDNELVYGEKEISKERTGRRGGGGGGRLKELMKIS